MARSLGLGRLHGPTAAMGGQQRPEHDAGLQPGVAHLRRQPDLPLLHALEQPLELKHQLGHVSQPQGNAAGLGGARGAHHQLQSVRIRGNRTQGPENGLEVQQVLGSLIVEEVEQRAQLDRHLGRPRRTGRLRACSCHGLASTGVIAKRRSLWLEGRLVVRRRV